MAQKLNVILNNFSKGEFSDRITGRVDIPGYYQGCKTMENFVMVAQGGAEVRPGTVYVGQPKYTDKKCRLIPFDVNDSEQFILEVGNLYLRVWKNDVLLTTIYGGGAEFLTSYLEADLFEIQYVQTEGVMYFTHIGYDVAKISYDGTTWLWDATVTFTDSPWSAPGEYPAACAFQDQRLVLGGSEKQPQTIWGSVIGSYEDMTQDPTLSAAAYAFTLATDKSSQVRWLLDKDILLVGAKTSELLFMQGVSAGNIQVFRQSAYGSAAINAVAISDAVIFLQRGRRKLREFVYSNDNQTYQAPDLTFFADHISESGIVEYDYQQAPDPILWCVRDDGVLVGMTYDRIMGVAGWHRHITDGEFESVAVLPGQDGEDQVYFTIKRNIQGSDIRYIEKFNKRDFGVLAQAVFNDASYTKVGVGLTEIDGLDHLEGEVVSILADGVVQTQQTVSGGKVPITGTATTITAGLPFIGTLTPVSIEIPGSSTMGSTRNIGKALLRLYNSQGGRVGVDDKYVDINYEGETDLFTGDKDNAIDANFSEKQEITIIQNDPLPLTVLAMVVEMTFNR